ncbi:MAG: hypothetical protein ACYSWP_08025 [Planctomycetota bacterium]
MKTMKGIQLLMLLVVCSLSFGAVEETEHLEGQLRFLVSSAPKEWDSYWTASKRIPKPSHVAIFRLKYWNDWRSQLGIGTKKRMVSDPNSKMYLQWGVFSGIPEEPEILMSGSPVDKKVPSELRVYANSEKEVRRIVKTLVEEGKKRSTERDLQREKGSLEEMRRKLAELEKEIPEIERNYKASVQALDTFLRTNKIDGTGKDVQVWNHKLDEIEVEIIGVKAKLETIKILREKEKVNGTWPGNVFESLLKMRMVSDVELAGALARKQAVQSFRKRLTDFLTLGEKVEKLEKQLRGKRNHLSTLRSFIPENERELTSLKALLSSMKPAEVVSNEVIIHPVK